MPKLWLPGRDRSTARAPVDPQKKIRKCEGCGTPFPAEQLAAFLRHVDACGRASDAEQQAHMAERESNAFLSGADKEAREWIRKRAAEGKPAAKNGRPA